MKKNNVLGIVLSGVLAFAILTPIAAAQADEPTKDVEREPRTNREGLEVPAIDEVDDQIVEDIVSETEETPVVVSNPEPVDVIDREPLRADGVDDTETPWYLEEAFLLKLGLGVGALAVFGAVVFLLKKLFGSKPNRAPIDNGEIPADAKKSLVPINTVAPLPQPKKKQKKPPAAGMVFPGSAMTAVSSSSGLAGPLVILHDALQATGRIGFAQQGVPTNDDVSFGTGFLISNRHVLTNRHVYEMYQTQLLNEGGGIEFFAEKGSDATDFIPFSGKEPKFVQGLDIAIFELDAPVSNRTWLALEPVPSAELDGREIAVIGYPCPMEVTDEIKAVVEDDPVFAVKRLSEGKIFKHSTDTDAVYGVETAVSKIINPTGKLNAICHNASTLGGSSGSPVLDRATGQLVGVHFGYDVAHNWEEGANFAIPVEVIAKVLSDLGIV